MFYNIKDNSNGQLGINNEDRIYKPRLLLNNPDIISIHCGGDFSIYLTVKGEIYFFGRMGPLKSLIPELIYTSDSISSLACGRDHALVLIGDGIYGIG